MKVIKSIIYNGILECQLRFYEFYGTVEQQSFLFVSAFMCGFSYNFFH
jgi:hypothetical protein